MRQVRMEFHFTQSDLAIIFGVSISTIDKWERGVTQPNEYNTNQIIEFLGYDPIQKTLTI
jgi:DNA-binding transcriptional regulator YiaG